ncbi:MAG: hypothetical protein U0R44_03940 [Candidatus Micrarchaeia archaeon]
MRKLAALVFLSLFSFVHAFVVGPAIYEQKDFGSEDLHQFTYSLSADCNASVINAVIYDEKNKPVGDVNLLLSYIDFAQPLLRNVNTDKDGLAVLKLPGQVSLMRGMFILVIQKTGYMNKEVHFDLYPCFHNGSLPPKPPKPAPKPANTTNQTIPAPPKNNSTNTPPAANTTKTNLTNATGNRTETPGSGAAPACPGAFAVILSIASLAISGRGSHYKTNQG